MHEENDIGLSRAGSRAKTFQRVSRWVGVGIALVLGLVLFPGKASARLVPLTILHTTDLHGHLLPTTDYDGHPGVGGLLQCAAQIDAWREKRPNALLIDCGDLFQGSPESFRSGGQVMMDALNHLRYDAWVLGNHDFDWGLDRLNQLIGQTATPVLAANIYSVSGQDPLLPPVRPYVMFEIDGVKVAVIGMITPGVPRWSRPELIQSALFKPTVEAMAEVLPRVKAEGADVIVLAAHQGYREFGDDHANELNAVARAYPELDAILGGHTHRPIEQASIHGVLYTQAGYHGIWLGILDMTYDTVARKVIHRSAQLERIGPDAPVQAELAETWRGLIEETRTELDRELATSKDRLTPHPSVIGISPIQRLIGRAIAGATQADLVLHGALSSAEIPEGPVTVRHVWEVVPYENTLGVALLNVAELREILDEALKIRPSPFMLAPYGFRYRIETEDGERRAVDLSDERGRPLHSRRRYRVAMNSYTLASGGDRYPLLRELAERPEAQLKMLETDTRSAVQAYVRDARVLSLDKIMKGVE